jgi:hypothetical protein
MIDPIVGQRALQRLRDVVLSDDLGEGVRPIAPVEREWGVFGRPAARVVEQRVVLGVLDSIPLGTGGLNVIEPRFFHACTLCRDGDSRSALAAKLRFHGSRAPALVRRSAWTCFSSPSDDEVGGLNGAIRARDVRAADLQEEPTKHLENGADSPTRSFRSDPTKTAAPRRTSQRAKRAIRHSERQRAEQSNPSRLRCRERRLGAL